ncbi:MAG: NAD-dependent epimerase/dehydratase family protein, partial [Acidobacteriota bacterium]|nr:NAD-dependent epimerase/dehydratase family protein [Acidobacteriota bacterium]
PREEIEIIRLLGAEVFALTLNSEGLDEDAAETERRRLESEVGFPVALPLEQGTDRVAEVLCRRLGLGRAAK